MNERSDQNIENNKKLKRIEKIKGITVLLLILLSFFAGIMIYIGIVNKSIHLAVGLIVLLLEVIVYKNAYKEMEELKKDVKYFKNKGMWGPL